MLRVCFVKWWYGVIFVRLVILWLSVLVIWGFICVVFLRDWVRLLLVLGVLFFFFDCVVLMVRCMIDEVSIK